MKSIFLKCIFSLLSATTIFSQSIFFDSGYSSLIEVRQICKCNHNSTKEIHSKAIKSNCHEKLEIRHSCKCKKTPHPNEITNQIKQIQILPTQFSFSIYFNFLYSINNLNIFTNLKGFTISILRPPR